MTKGAFIADIKANPDDDVPRLIFADWLEDQGEVERAEFIRAAVNDPGSWYPAARWADDYYNSLACRENLSLSWERGFVDHIRCSFSESASLKIYEVISQNPVRGVSITGQVNLRFSHTPAIEQGPSLDIKTKCYLVLSADGSDCEVQINFEAYPPATARSECSFNWVAQEAMAHLLRVERVHLNPLVSGTPLDAMRFADPKIISVKAVAVNETVEPSGGGFQLG